VVHAAQFGDFTYVEYDTYIEITDFPEDAIGDIVIPSEIVGKPVTSIGRAAFYECTRLTNITIGNGVTSIGFEAFLNCRSLTSVTIPDSVTTIGALSFEDCTQLKSIFFWGDAPTVMPYHFQSRYEEYYVYEIFRDTPVKIAYYEDAGGFTSPSWQDRPSEAHARIAPTIQGEPISVAFDEGADVVFTLEATSFGGHYQWTKNGVELVDGGNLIGAQTASLILNGVLPADAGNYTLIVTDGGGSVSSVSALLSIWSPDDGPISNLSTRGQVLSENDILIAGLVITGIGTRTMLVRGIGPALGEFLEPETVVSDPMIVVFSGSDEIAGNDDWSDQPDSEAVADLTEAVGAFPLLSGSKDAALRLDLEPGAYSVHLSSKDGAGIGLVELYDGSDGSDARLMNISTRGRVGIGDSIMVPGIVVTSNPRRLLIRGVGPELAVSFGFAPESVLPNPILTLKNRDGVTLATNDDWGANEDPAMIASVSQQVGAFPLTGGGADAVLLIEVPAGVYTAHVSDAAGGKGIALVEVYGAP